MCVDIRLQLLGRPVASGETASRSAGLERRVESHGIEGMNTRLPRLFKDGEVVMALSRWSGEISVERAEP
jgi:hypothetical protein